MSNYSEEEKEVLNFFENKEYSFTCEVPKKELYEALGIEETDFETEVIRINTLINLIKKQQKEIEELKKCYVIKPKELEKEINKEWQEKIKSEIKELKKMELTKVDIFSCMRDYAILILQELLEE